MFHACVYRIIKGFLKPRKITTSVSKPLVPSICIRFGLFEIVTSPLLEYRFSFFYTIECMLVHNILWKLIHLFGWRLKIVELCERQQNKRKITDRLQSRTNRHPTKMFALSLRIYTRIFANTTWFNKLICRRHRQRYFSSKFCCKTHKRRYIYIYISFNVFPRVSTRFNISGGRLKLYSHRSIYISLCLKYSFL